jgi:uncharacterized protein YjbI with pentapeptide repeats
MEMETIKLERTKQRLEATDTNMSESTFTNVSLAGATFNDVNLSNATFRNVKLAGATINEVDLSNATFHNVKLAGAVIHDVNLSGVQIHQADLRGASIRESLTDAMTIDGIAVADLFAAYRAVHGKGK